MIQNFSGFTPYNVRLFYSFANLLHVNGKDADPRIDLSTNSLLPIERQLVLKREQALQAVSNYFGFEDEITHLKHFITNPNQAPVFDRFIKTMHAVARDASKAGTPLFRNLYGELTARHRKLLNLINNNAVLYLHFGVLDFMSCNYVASGRDNIDVCLVHFNHKTYRPQTGDTIPIIDEEPRIVLPSNIFDMEEDSEDDEENRVTTSEEDELYGISLEDSESEEAQVIYLNRPYNRF